VRDEDHDDHALLAALAVKVAHIEAEVDRLEHRFTLLARFVPVEKAVFSIIGIIAVALIGIAIQRLFGGHV
jgi:hypothetical protein